MRALRLPLALSFALFAAAPAHAEGERWLGYHWENVVSARYRVVHHEESVTVREGKSTPSTATVETDLLLLPGTRGEKETLIEVRLERVRIQLEPQGLDADSDATSNPRGGPLAALPKVVAATRATPLRIALSPGGRALRVEGLAAFLEAARSGLPESPQRDGLLRTILPVSEADLADRIAAIVLPLPNRAVAQGTALPVPLAVPGSAEPQNATITFTGVETVDGREALRIVRALSAEALPPTTVTQGEQSVVVTTTRYATEATLLLSPTLGIPLSQVATTTSAQTVGPPGAGGTPGGSLVETNRTVEATLVAHEPSAATTAPGPPASPPAVPAPPPAPGG